MTERDYNKIKKHQSCPFIHTVKLKEHKKLTEIANLKDGNRSFELCEKDNETGKFGIPNDIRIIEELVLADKRTYEGFFIKFYNTKFLCSLNVYAIKIFVYITEKLETNNNRVILDIIKIGVECSISEPRKIYEGLAELIEKNVIAKHNTKDFYYINPNLIFKGANRRILKELEDY